MSLIGSDTATNIIVFLALGIVLGTILEWILSTFKIPLPYTVVVFYTGVVLGIIVDVYNLDISSYFDLSGASATVILYVFLPVLLFSEAMTLNLHHLMQFFNQALLLAGPGAIIVCILIALCSKAILPFDWPWTYCFLFGAIFCATDPVSVVATLKASKASTKLTMIISGESLLNDGSAMILFLFFFNMISGVTYTAPLFISFCADMLILSPLIGIVIGLIIVQFMRMLFQPLNDHIDLQILLTFIAAYLSYLIAAYFAQVSGVLSCCSAGLMIAFFAPIRILENEKYHLIWSNAEWACNTLIFLLAGFIGGLNVTYQATVSNVGFLVIMFVVITIIRGIMLFALLPITNRLGKQCTVEEMLFGTHAGLRGALGIALALQAATSAAISDNDSDDIYGEQIFFVTTGLASFTLLLNGSTAPWVLLKLKLVADPNAPVSPQLDHMLTRIKLFMSRILRQELISLKPELGKYNEEEVLSSCTILNTNMLHHATSGNLQKTLQSSEEKKKRIRNKGQQQSQKPVEEGATLEMQNKGQKGEKEEIDAEELANREGETEEELIEHLRQSMIQQYHATSNQRLASMQMNDDLLQFIRKTVLAIVRGRYEKAIVTGKIGSGSVAARLLLYSIEVATDYTHFRLNDWDVIVHALLPNRYLTKSLEGIDWIFLQCFRVSLGLAVFHDAYYERVMTFAITNFIDAHEYAQSQLKFCLGGLLFDSEDDLQLKTPEELQIESEAKEMITRAKNVLNHFSQEDLEIVYTHRAINVLITKQAELLHTIVDEGILSDQNAKYFYDMIEEERNKFSQKRKVQTRGMLVANIHRKLKEDEDVSFRDSMTGMISMQDLKKHAVERALTASLDQSNRISEMTEQSYVGTKPSMIQNESMSAVSSSSSSVKVNRAGNEEENDEDRSCFMSNNSTISNEFRPKSVRSVDGRRLHGSYVFNAVTVDIHQHSTFNPLRHGADNNQMSRAPSTATSVSTIANEEQHDKRS